MTPYTSQIVAAAGGRRLHPVKASVATSQLLAAHVRIVAGDPPPRRDAQLTVVLAASAFDLVATEAPAQLRSVSAVVPCLLRLEADGTAIYKSEPFIAEGPYLYAWMTADELAADVTVSVEVTEL